MKSHLLGYLLVLGLSVGITGCGGGGGGSNSDGGRTVSPVAVPSATSSSIVSSLSVSSSAASLSSIVSSTLASSSELSSSSLSSALPSSSSSLLSSLISSSSSSSSLTPQFVVTASGGTGGSLSPANQSVSANATATLNVAADPGYGLADISGCGGSLDGNTFITAAVTGDCTVTASFTPLLHSVGGSVSGASGAVRLTYQFEHPLETGTETLDVAQNGAFSFARPAPWGSTYQIVVAAAPARQVCSVANGSGVVAGDVVDVAVTCENVFSVSGTISPGSLITTDSDVNDLNAPFTDNSVPSVAQPINHLALVHGFASAQGTGGNTALERFALVGDTDDIFQVTLEAGQSIQLQVVDYKSVAEGGNGADLDLYVFDSNFELVAVSEGDGEFETITVPSTQTYLINIHALTSASKYVLQLSPPSTTATSVSVPPEFVPNEMIVKYADDPSTLFFKPSPSGGAANIARRPTLERPDLSNLSQNRSIAEMMPYNRLACEKVMTLRSIKLKAQEPGVVYAEPNYIRRSLLTPNDPQFSLQWHYNTIGLPSAWNVTTGTENSVIVAVVDTGILLAHPDMAGQTIAGYDFISNADRARDGNGIDSDANDPGDSDLKGHSSWHGTHVGGTVAAASNNGAGVAGVSWGAKLMPIRVLGKDGGTSYDIIQGLRYAAGLPNDSQTVPARRADIANLSYGGPYGSRAEREAYQAVRAAGVILVGSAGNAASSEPQYPAAYPEVISVSATDYANKLAPYSSYGATVALSAPGGNNGADLNRDGQPDGVLSASADDSRGSIRYVYRFYNGTSMAAPHVAGVLALMKSVYPALTPALVDSLIQDGSLSDDLGVAGRDDFYGYGLINALKAVNVAANLAAGSMAPTEPAPNVVAVPSRVDLGFMSSAEIELINDGGGSPSIVSVSDNADWLTVAPGVVDASGLGSYVFTVNRTAMTSGNYEAEAVFTLNDGSVETVPVTMSVDAVSGTGVLSQLYVGLVNAETLALVYGVLGNAEAGGTMTYSFTDVRAGTYYLFAGTDVDADRRTCEPGEICGAVSNAGLPRTIEITADTTGLDFIVDILRTPPTLSGTAAASP